ncbi:MAG TPA: type III-A CRISPR-associated RAMP protein Csm5, partial [Armatimonadetes bacterium]|nr:type III-A CRISPR-associated RAMP protein Csm5 [Armatimonadota bacterium]
MRNERLLETLCANASYSLKCFLPLKGRWRDLHTLIKLPSEGAMAYIPGSEIKGAMRTALLWWLLRNDAQLRNWLHNALKQFKRQFANALDGVHGRDIREKIPVNVIPEEELNKLKQRRLRIKSGRVSVSNLKFALARILERDVTQKLERRAFRGSVSIDAQYDALRVIQIGDSSVVPQDYLAVIPIVIIGLSSDLELWHEAIMPGAKITSSFRAPTDEDALWSQMTAQFGYSGKLCEALSSVERLFSILHEFSQAVLQD